MRTGRSNEEGEGRAIMERTIFALNVCTLWSKVYWFWRWQGRVTGIAGVYGGRDWRIEGTMMEEPRKRPLPEPKVGSASHLRISRSSHNLSILCVSSVYVNQAFLHLTCISH